MTTTPPPGLTTPPEGFVIDPRLGAVALRAPAASREDSHPQAILKSTSKTNKSDIHLFLRKRLENEDC